LNIVFDPGEPEAASYIAFGLRSRIMETILSLAQPFKMVARLELVHAREAIDRPETELGIPIERMVKDCQRIITDEAIVAREMHGITNGLETL